MILCMICDEKLKVGCLHYSLLALIHPSYKYPELTTFPDKILVDSSFIISTYGKPAIGGGGDNEICQEFLRDYVKNNTKLCITPDIHQEVEHAHKNAAMRKVAIDNHITIPQFKNKAINYKALRKAIDEKVPTFSNRLTNSVNTLRTYLGTMHMLEYISDCEFNEKVDYISDQLGGYVNSDDIKHVLVAHEYGINTVLTLDGDFYRFDNLNVLTLPNSWLDNERLSRRNVFLEYKNDEV